MSKKLLMLLCFCFIIVTGAFADWNEGEPAKWVQLPDLTPTGIDICVDDTDDTGTYPVPQRTIGDDFECTSTGPITDVHFWGSWRNDIKGQITAIHVSFYTDDPVGPGGTNPDNEWSTPDILEWDQWFDAAQFTERLYYTMPDGQYEGWWDPRTAGSYTPLGDTEVYQYNINIPQEPFVQQGTPDNPVIYWLVIEVKIDQTIDGSSFGWKTSRFQDRWNDDAAWYGAQWVDIEYPNGHEYSPDSLDMSFVLTSNEPEELDFGDAPDGAVGTGPGDYQTVLADNGPSHIIGGPWLGDPQDNPDPEPDGQQNAAATGDDGDGNDDEDGVQIPILVQGQLTSITMQVNGGGGNVYGWIDYNGNGIFNDAGELLVAATYADGIYTPNFTPPTSSIVGTTYARFRISNDFSLPPTGPASDGEVEDHIVTIEAEPTDPDLDFGDAPEGANAIAYPSLGVAGQFPHHCRSSRLDPTQQWLTDNHCLVWSNA